MDLLLPRTEGELIAHTLTQLGIGGVRSEASYGALTTDRQGAYYIEASPITQVLMDDLSNDYYQ